LPDTLLAIRPLSFTDGPMTLADVEATDTGHPRWS
jgi:hypothetical protein